MSAFAIRLRKTRLAWVGAVSVLLLAAALAFAWMKFAPTRQETASSAAPASSGFKPRKPLETGGFSFISNAMKPWKPDATLQEVAASWKGAGQQILREAKADLAAPGLTIGKQVQLLDVQAICKNYEGKPQEAYELLRRARVLAERDPAVAEKMLYALIYLQGVTALRMGENDNCVNCRGISACILPLSRAAIHTKPQGSRLAVKHFTEYLRQFPDDLEVCWLLNVAHMTLGDPEGKIDPKFRLPLEAFLHSTLDIGKFRDIAHTVGLERTNQAGGAIMDDFDNDGLLDIVLSSFDPQQAMAFYRNTGDGKFQDRTREAGLLEQLGGLNCRQGDYDNDGDLDIFVARGAWLPTPIRPSLLRSNGRGVFTDVTKEAGLLTPVNSNSAEWRDYDNDGYLDLFVCCEKQPNRLYHNSGNGKFQEVAGHAGLLTTTEKFCKGAAWIDYDRDNYPDLFLNFLDGQGRLFHNNRNGMFTDVSSAMGIDGPRSGFSCWAWDYDNDGWEDLFATCYERTVSDVVRGLVGQPHQVENNRLFRNVDGKRFVDETAKAGLNLVFSTMGSNFGDLDNDGYLDMYLGTGDPGLSSLVPERMFKNVAGEDRRSFTEISASSGTGHLQKGHGVAMGDWDRDGNVDLFIELGGAVPGDRYHNVLFQNPGHDNDWLTVKLVGKKTNRCAIGARIRVTTGGATPRSVNRCVSAGSSFGGNPLVQTIGLGKAGGPVTLEVFWPTSGTTQVFRDVAVNRGVEVTEFAAQPRPLPWTRVTPAPAVRVAAVPAK